MVTGPQRLPLVDLMVAPLLSFLSALGLASQAPVDRLPPGRDYSRCCGPVEVVGAPRVPVKSLA